MLVPQCYIDRMPKEVDHDARRRELADAASRVIARNGLSATTLAQVAEESGWSIGSIRYYFPNKDELIASARDTGAPTLAEIAPSLPLAAGA